MHKDDTFLPVYLAVHETGWSLKRGVFLRSETGGGGADERPDGQPAPPAGNVLQNPSEPRVT